MLHDALAPKLMVMKQVTVGIFYLLLCDQCIYETFSYCNQEFVTAICFLAVSVTQGLRGVREVK